MIHESADPAVDSRRYYDSLAGEFRAQDSFWDNPYDREIWRLEHDLMRPYLNHPGPLLDPGCGFYPHFEFTRERAVFAGDISLGSLRVAREFGDESRQVQLVQFDVSALPFASGRFGYAIAGGELLNHVPDYPIVLGEIRRVLQPDGYLLLQVGAKWCLDTFWAIADALLGHHIGYSMTRAEATAFLCLRQGDLPVTWGITPSGNFRIWLLSIRKLKQHLAASGFKVRQAYGADGLSGLVPLPLQQESDSATVHWLVTNLIRLDRVVGALPFFRTFAGNVFILCQATGGLA